MNARILSVVDFSLSYGGLNTPLFNPVSFELNEGEALVVTGDNGSGKSSLLQFIASQSKALKAEKSLRSIGRFHLEDSVARSIVFIGQQLGAEFSFPITGQDLMSLFGQLDSPLVSEKMKRLAWNEMSGGEKKRIWISLQTSLEPKLLILDEVFHQLDLESRQLIHNALELHLKRGGSILMSHHNQDFSIQFRHQSLQLESPILSERVGDA
jgi:ABC-type Mn2+/Zn2+ transport system ATPase subunit